jgi:glycosyltransferase involved in cell wall biosynthesis
VISVIIPNYNNARYVATAINSVLAQNHPDVEIIVVDDGSTDNSRAVITAFGERVRYLWQANQGLAGARNTGIRAARGEWIGLLDADDEWCPTYLTTISKLIDQDRQAAVYYSAASCMDSDGADLPRHLGAPIGSPDQIYQTLVRANFLIPSTIVMRAEVVRAAGLFDQTLRSCEDWDLWLRIAPTQRFVGTAEPLVRYRVHNASLSANLTGMHQAAQAVIEKNFGPPEGEPAGWPVDKRRAYGGLYRYYGLTSVQRQNNWAAAGTFLGKALQFDASLATDLDLFYELAFGTQSVGHRGTAHELNMACNAARVEQMLHQLFVDSPATGLAIIRNQLYGTVYYALGLASYNTGALVESRHFFCHALRHRPALWRERRVVGNLIRSLAGPTGLNWLRQRRRQFST